MPKLGKNCLKLTQKARLSDLLFFSLLNPTSSGRGSVRLFVPNRLAEPNRLTFHRTENVRNFFKPQFFACIFAAFSFNLVYQRKEQNRLFLKMAKKCSYAINMRQC
jgi:hypothetical protein